MQTQYTILRVWVQTARRLKILAAMTGESMIAMMDRLVTEEAERRKIPLPDEGKPEDHLAQ